MNFKTLFIYIKLTNQCQLKCQHCYNSIVPFKDSMSDETLNDVIRFLTNLRKDNPDTELAISLHGGEPMQYDLNKIQFLLDSTSNLNLKWGITTNLVYPLDQSHLNILYQMHPFTSSQTFIQTSWDYKIRFKGSQENLWTKNVLYLISHNVDVQPTICLTNILLGRYTARELMYKMVNELNLHHLNFERITNTGRAVENHLRPNNNELDRWLFDAYLVYKEIQTQRSFKIPLFEGVEESIKHNYIGCRGRICSQTVITINPDGSIAGCPNTANFKTGNLKTGFDATKKQIMIRRESTPFNDCLLCKHFEYCRGDCFQLAADETGCQGIKSIYDYINS